MQVIEFDENTKLPAKLIYGISAFVAFCTVVSTTVIVKMEFAQADILDLKHNVSEMKDDQGNRREKILEAINDLKLEVRELKASLPKEK